MLDRIGHLIKRPGLPDPSYRFLLEAEPADEAVSLDCETTGFDPRVDEVVSIAAIRIAGRRILASSAFRALVRPEGAMRPDSIKVHRLRQQDVAQAQPMSEVLLLYFIGSRPLVGYWIQFDVRMLDEYLLAMIDMRLPSRQIDVSPRLRSQIREHAARHVRRFALCRHSRRSETAHAGATRCIRGRPRRGQDVSRARGHAGAQRAVAASEVRSSRRLLDRLSGTDTRSVRRCPGWHTAGSVARVSRTRSRPLGVLARSQGVT